MAKKTPKNSCLDCKWAQWNLLRLQGYGSCTFPVELLVFPKAFPVRMPDAADTDAICKDNPYTECPCYQIKPAKEKP